MQSTFCNLIKSYSGLFTLEHTALRDSGEAELFIREEKLIIPFYHLPLLAAKVAQGRRKRPQPCDEDSNKIKVIHNN